MPITRLALALVVLLAACTQDPDAGRRAFTADNGHIVVPLGAPLDFEVLSRAGASGRDYFCAASEYSIRRLRAGPTDRLLVTEPLGPSLSTQGRRAARFTLAASGTVPRRQGITASVSRRGENLRVAQARSFCGDSLEGINIAFGSGGFVFGAGTSFGFSTSGQ